MESYEDADEDLVRNIVRAFNFVAEMMYISERNIPVQKWSHELKAFLEDNNNLQTNEMDEA